MMSGFRLLRAAGSFELRNRRVARGEREPNNGSLEVEFSPLVHRGSESWVTVVIGRNGVGKSRLLAGIADVFDRIDEGRGSISRDSVSVSLIEYMCEGRHVVLKLNERDVVFATCDGQKCSPSDLPLPGKIIALTTTPFDKFRVSRSAQRLPDRPVQPEGRYTYLGLRDRTGRASTTATIFRALEGLFEASKGSDERRLRIADIFAFLGYEPRVEVRYRFRVSERARIQQLIDGASVEEIISPYETRPSSRGLQRFRDDPEAIELIRKVGREVNRRGGLQSFSLQADFLGWSDDDMFFRDVQQLRRLGVVEMTAVEVQRQEDGTILDLRHASSGELGIVTGFLGLASVIRDNSLVFIDEPEISLHPEWQTRYLELLTRTFARFHGCHFILATHSPLILSDIGARSSSVVSLDPDRRRAESALAFAGKSYDYLLATAFEEPGNNNLFVKEEIIRALRLAADGKSRSPEFAELLGWLTSIKSNLQNDSPIVELIEELREAAKLGGVRL
jgi:predicted ATPase